MHHNDMRRDFAADSRLLRITAIAAAVGVLSTGTAYLLLLVIRFFTNLFFFQTWSIVARSPAVNTLGPWVIAVPAIGGLIIGLLARYGSEQIRGHGLGLSLCREIARAHHGEVVLHLASPAWTEFRVTLPAIEAPHLGDGI
jgi:H+/Cl- antiporter ClcA